MKNISVFHLKIFSNLEVKITIYLNRRDFVRNDCLSTELKDYKKNL